MNRWYYDDPLAAAWMAKHFGMQLTYTGGELPGQGLVDYQSFKEALDWYENEIKRYYIHPDSLHLLEPKKGDLLHLVRGFTSHYKTVDDIATGGGKAATGVWCGGEHWDITTKKPLHDWEIIQRNGIPFHWPKKDNENE